MNRRSLLAATTALAVVLAGITALPARAATGKAFRYAVLISEQAAADPRWNEVATTLVRKYPGARGFTYRDLNELVAPLRQFSPDYIAFVCTPGEATPGFVREAGTFNRKLDNEPYGAAVWGIVTGYGPEDALRIARNDAPPKIRFGLGGMLGFLDALPEGVAYSEFTDDRVHWQEKRPGKGVRDRRDAPADHTLAMLRLINGNGADGVWTSGHAEKDAWSVYYPDGTSFLVAENGGLTAVIDGESRGAIRSTNPKIYLGIGNCLTARIEDPNASYALSWIHSGGVHQYFGFTVETYYGLMGWSTADNFFYRGSRFNVAEAAFAANQALLLALEARLAPGEVEDMEYDRDATVVYGDPAWMAVVPEATAREVETWSTRLERSTDGNRIRWELIATFRKDTDFRPSSGKDLRSVFAFLPERVKRPRLAGRSTGVAASHLASNFVVVHFEGRVGAGQTRKLVFESDP